MKQNVIKVLSYFFFGVLLLNAGQVFGQGVTNPSSGQKQLKGESTTPVQSSSLKGEWTKSVDCVDLFVKKGCVNYSVAFVGDKAAVNPATVKVCANPQSKKPINICHKGAKGVTVKYEKLDGSTDIEFRPTDNKAMQKQ